MLTGYGSSLKLVEFRDFVDNIMLGSFSTGVAEEFVQIHRTVGQDITPFDILTDFDQERPRSLHGILIVEFFGFCFPRVGSYHYESVMAKYLNFSHCSIKMADHRGYFRLAFFKYFFDARQAGDNVAAS